MTSGKKKKQQPLITPQPGPTTSPFGFVFWTFNNDQEEKQQQQQQRKKQRKKKGKKHQTSS